MKKIITLLVLGLILSSCFLDITDGDNNDDLNGYFREISNISTEGFTYAVKLNNSKIYAANGYSGLTIHDTDYLNEPTLIEQYETFGLTYELDFNSDGFIVTASGTDGVHIFDPNQPFGLEKISTILTQNAFDVCTKDDIVYVADGDGGLDAFDLTFPENPQTVFENMAIDQVCNTVTVKNDFLLLGRNGGINVYDILDNNQLDWIVTINTTEKIYDIEIVNNTIYVAAEESVKVYSADWQNYNFEEISEINIYNQVRDVNVESNILYVSATYGGLMMYNISNSSNPEKIDEFYSNTNANYSDVYGDYIFVANGSEGIKILKYVTD